MPHHGANSQFIRVAGRGSPSCRGNAVHWIPERHRDDVGDGGYGWAEGFRIILQGDVQGVGR